MKTKTNKQTKHLDVYLCEEELNTNHERSTEKWFAVLQKENHPLSFPVPSILLGNIIKQREVQELIHPGHSQFQSSISADLPASRLLWEILVGEQGDLSLEDVSRNPR